MGTLSGRDRLQQLVLRLVRELSPNQGGQSPVDLESHLGRDLGIDSLTGVALTFRLEEETGLKLTSHLERLGGIRTVNDIINVLARWPADDK